MKLPWWLRATPHPSAPGEVAYALRVHRIYLWWLYAVAVWTALRAVRIEVQWRRGRR